MRSSSLSLSLIFAFTAFFGIVLQSNKSVASLQATLGPEIFYMERRRAGGTFQEGRMDGARLILERIEPRRIYLALDVLYAEGKFRGHNRSGRKIASSITDTIAEVRAGYTLENVVQSSTFTPFAGYGYFREINDFHAPSPLPFTFTDSFQYFLFGFLSSLNFNPLLSMGFNFEIKCMQQGKNRISDDPQSSEITLQMNSELQARVELPWILRFSPTSPYSWEFVPFYEFRHFGGQEAFPYNYIDTKFQIVGGRVALKYRF